MYSQHFDLGELSLLQPTVHYICLTRGRPNRIWGPRAIPDCHLVYVVSGLAKLTIGAEERLVQPGHCAFYGVDSVTQIVSTEEDPVTYYSLHFEWNTPSPTPMSLPQLLSGIRYTTGSELNGPATSYSVRVPGYGAVDIPHFFAFPGAEPMLLQMLREYEAKEPGYDFVLRGLLGRLLAALIRLQLGNTSHGELARKIAPALKAIEKQPETDWSTAALAELCGYNTNYFTGVFKAATGTSPKSFIIAGRMRRAKKLLLEEDTVEKAARKAGYTSLHYFCRHFKAETGQTPTQFKKQLFDL
ncbi:AraC family transcriptional regulator [Paenibacillus allorhizosphaerae]|uniref:HTH araC/xylS-type domain-containing protein n=1 Tax=Paenibacillus allorhizosphaerae TaxID=2849866 RepID=A0ABM8VFN6_9BACL|nr:AraC family transcriptional regulator [Paenibacillus allorhizosphaerae]CAG7635678.1 hypothetical protein PAECIP111802_02167 [Paenibacillus allorhizosphaerae]